jgi:RsiW-degrading membrane proteinase PrsW (M82 family)
MRFAGTGVALVISAPVGEEFFKGLFILGVFLLRRDEFDGIIDGVVYAAMVGLGFAAMENIQYYGKVVHEGAVHVQEVSEALRSEAMAEGRINVAVIFLLRGVFGPFAHPLFTSMTGIGFGLAAQVFRGPMRVLAPLLGYALAVLLHAIWNGTAGIGGLPFFIAAYVLIFLPTFVGLAILARYSLKKETELVRAQLQSDVISGYLAPEDFEMLSSLRGRQHDLREAWRRGGRALLAARRAFHQAATDLAFHRFRVARGITPFDPEAEVEHFHTINEIQKRIAALVSIPNVG